MPIFSAKERRAHYNGVGYGNAPVKKDSQYPEEIQRAYARGQADALNRQAMAAVLGKNSKLSDEEKATIRQENKEMRAAARAGDTKRLEQIKSTRRKRVQALNSKKR